MESLTHIQWEVHSKLANIYVTVVFIARTQVLFVCLSSLFLTSYFCLWYNLGGVHYYKGRLFSLLLNNKKTTGQNVTQDTGEVVVFLGSGGMDSKGLPVKDQKIEKANNALYNAIDFKTPFRLIRGSNLDSCFAPLFG